MVECQTSKKKEMEACPQIITDFEKHVPASVEVLAPDEKDAPKRETPEYKAAYQALIDQIFSKESLSKDIISKTHFVILYRNLPEIDGTRDVNNFHWFAGHYQWDELIKRVTQQEVNIGQKMAVFLVPTLGQSDMLSIRHELTYNAFIAPETQPPFEYIVQRHVLLEDENVDQELFKKSDTCTFPSLNQMGLEWEKLTEFTNEKFPNLDHSIPVFILKLSKSFQTSFKAMYKSTPDKIEEWYDTVLKNFLPLIPYPLNDGKFTKIPLELIDSIEATPPCYHKLIELVTQINEQFSSTEPLTQEKVSAIQNVIKYWQFEPNSINEELVIFANNNNSIPVGSPEFNKLFFNQLSIVKYFIIDEIFGRYLGFKRAGDFEMYKDAPSEIEEEIEIYDNSIKKGLLFAPQPIKDKFTPIFEELKKEIEFWFDKANLNKIYGEFKEAISRSMIEILQSDSMKEYIKISNEENSTKHEWLDQYYDFSRDSLLYCLWPTIYSNSLGVLHEGEPNSILKEVESSILKNVSTNSTIPEARGKPIPPK